MTNYRQKGFTIVEVLIAVVVVTLIAFLGWKSWETFSTDQSTSNDANSSQTSEQTVPAVNNEQDLNEVDKMLDDTNVDSGHEQQLESETSF